MTSDPTVHAGESASFRRAVPRKLTPAKPEVSPGTPGRASAEQQFSQVADFVDIVAVDTLAKTVADHLAKGRRIAVTGRLGRNTWTTTGGAKRSKLQVVADTVIFLDRPKTDAAAGPGEHDEPKSAQPAGRSRKRTA